MGRGDDGKCEKLLIPRRRGHWIGFGTAGDIRHIALVLYLGDGDWMERLWTGPYSHGNLSHIRFSMLCAEIVATVLHQFVLMQYAPQIPVLDRGGTRLAKGRRMPPVQLEGSEAGRKEPDSAAEWR